MRFQMKLIGVVLLGALVRADAAETQSRFVEVFGQRMHYVELGEGDPILFIHGQPASSYLWRNVMPHVAKRGRAIAIDLIGMGQSGKPKIEYRYADHIRYLEGFIQALGLKNITLVGHDWGSVLAMDYAMRHGGNVSGLVLMEALIPPVFPLKSIEALPSEARELFAGFRDPVMGRKLLIEQNVFIEKMLPGMTRRALTKSEMDAYRAPFLDPTTREPLYRWPNELPIAGKPADMHARFLRIGAWLKKTTLPKLHLYASPGVVNPPPVAAWTAANLKNIETAYIGPGLHFVQEDQPEAIGRAMEDWLRRLPPPRPAYVYVSFSVTDAGAFDRYKKLAGPTLDKYGGKLAARTGSAMRLEGTGPRNVVILTFPSAEQARAWYRSPEYRRAKDEREGAATMEFVLVEANG